MTEPIDFDKLSREADRIKERVNSFFPPEFKGHYRTARREFWLALRSLVDSRIDNIEREHGEPAEPPKPPKTGPVDIQ